MEELWLDIKDYEGVYQVSSHGRVRSVDRVLKYSDGRVYKQKGIILHPSIGGTTPYLSVMLSVNQVTKRINVHRLVCETFKRDSFFDGAEVNHIDENQHNNFSSNLEWVTSSQNKIHSARYGKYSNSFKHFWRTPKGVYETLTAAAEDNGVSRGTVRNRCYNTEKFPEWVVENSVT